MDCVLFTLVCHWGEQYIKAMLSCGVALLLCSQEAQKQQDKSLVLVHICRPYKEGITAIDGAVRN